MKKPIELRCPKCRKRAISITETAKQFGNYHQSADGKIDEIGYFNPGAVLRVDCTCDECGHMWRPRGVLQVSDFAGHKWNLAAHDAQRAEGQKGEK